MNETGFNSKASRQALGPSHHPIHGGNGRFPQGVREQSCRSQLSPI